MALADELFNYVLTLDREKTDAYVRPRRVGDTRVTGPPEQTRLTARELFGDLDLSTSYSLENPMEYEENFWVDRR